MGGWRIYERLADGKSAIQQDAILRYKAKNFVLHPAELPPAFLAGSVRKLAYASHANRIRVEDEPQNGGPSVRLRLVEDGTAAFR